MSLGCPVAGDRVDYLEMRERLHGVVVLVAGVPLPGRLGHVGPEVGRADVSDRGGEPKQSATEDLDSSNSFRKLILVF